MLVLFLKDYRHSFSKTTSKFFAVDDVSLRSQVRFEKIVEKHPKTTDDPSLTSLNASTIDLDQENIEQPQTDEEEQTFLG